MTPDLNKLDSLGFLKQFSKEDLSFLSEIATEASFSAGNPVFEQGDTNSDLFLMLKGEADVLLVMPNEDADVNIHVVPEGSVFGHFSFMDRQPRSATVKAKTDLTVLRMSRDDFDRLKQERPILALNLMEALSASICHAIRGENEFLQSFLDYRSVSSL